MNEITRRKLLKTGIGVAASAGGIAAVAKVAQSYELIPPDRRGIYGLGETLNYATHRLTSHSLAREFPRSAISKVPFANELAPPNAAFRKLRDDGFRDWKLSIDGMLAQPASLSLAELKSYPSRSQITHLACEEGWSYIAEWKGVPLADLLLRAGIRPQAKYIVYFSIEKDWWDSIDITDALHPQTLVAYGLNGGDLPVPNGGPLRMRLPKQLGYKSVKFLNRVTLTDNLKQFGKGLGSASPEGGYSWYAGI